MQLSFLQRSKIRFLVGRRRWQMRGTKLARVLKTPLDYGHRKLLAGRPEAGSSVVSVLDSLRDYGYAYYQSPDLKFLDELIDQSRKLIREVPKDKYFNRKNQLNVFNWHEAGHDPSGVFVRFVLQNALYPLVVKYLGIIPRLEYVKVLLSRPNQEPVWEHSQLWHRDRGDFVNLKVFVAIEDIADVNGPFHFLPAPESRVVADRYFTKGRVEDDEVAQLIPRESWKKFVGSAGSVLLIDTERCYHFGSRCQTDRSLYVAYFSTGYGVTARDPRLPKALGQKQEGELGLTHAQYLALVN